MISTDFSKNKMAEYMVKAGVIWGHSIQELNPKMKRYLWHGKQYNPNHNIINVMSTIWFLNAAIDFVRKVVQQKGQFLIVGTHLSKADLVTKYAAKAQCHYINHKWLGGMLTNWSTTEHRIQLLQHLENQEKSGMMAKLPKREASLLKKKKKKTGQIF